MTRQEITVDRIDCKPRNIKKKNVGGPRDLKKSLTIKNKYLNDIIF